MMTLECMRVGILCFLRQSTFFSHIKHMQLVFNVNVFLQAAQASVAVGSQVWVEDPDVAWIDGEVIKVNGDTVTVKCSNEKTVCCIWQVWGLVLAL